MRWCSDLHPESAWNRNSTCTSQKASNPCGRTHRQDKASSGMWLAWPSPLSLNSALRSRIAPGLSRPLLRIGSSTTRDHQAGRQVAGRAAASTRGRRVRRSTARSGSASRLQRAPWSCRSIWTSTFPRAGPPTESAAARRTSRTKSAIAQVAHRARPRRESGRRRVPARARSRRQRLRRCRRLSRRHPRAGPGLRVGRESAHARSDRLRGRIDHRHHERGRCRRRARRAGLPQDDASCGSLPRAGGPSGPTAPRRSIEARSFDVL
jgi:hypothetical protein